MPTEPTGARDRFDRIDVLRGLAIAWMTAYHFAFDLDHFGWIREDFHRDPLWTWQRTAIVTLFLFCAGLGQAVAVAQGQGWGRFWRRWAQVAGCALLVTAGSWFMFPRSIIYFGVLHGIAVMLVVTRLTARWGRWLWLAGALAIVFHLAAPPPPGSVFDDRWLNWLGWISRKPVTQDYVPLLPWLGVMWWGLAAGQWLMLHRPAWLRAPLARTGALAWMGRHSLSWYMLHQLVLIGAIAAATAVVR